MSCWEILLAPTDPPSAATFFPEYSRVRYTNLRFNPTPTSYADAIVPFPIINNQVYNDTTSKEAKLNWANVPQAVKDPLKIIWAYGDAVMLVIDQSGSMEGGPMELAKKAAKRFVKELPGGTALGLIAFSNSARLLVSPAPLPGGFLSFFGGRSQYTNLIGDLQASGNTAMYDAVRLACSELTAKYPGRWKTVVLISDGQDNSSSASLNRIISDYKDNINVYTVGTGEGYDRGALTALAGNMNGEFKDATPKNFNDVMDSVAESSGVNKIVDDIIKSRTVLSRSAAARMLTPLSAARGDVAAKEFFIDDSVAAAIVSVAYNGVAGDISCALRDPSGNAFAGEVKDDGGEWMAVIANPAVGRWTLDITYNTARDMNVEFDVVAHLREGKSGYGVSFGFLGDQVFLSEIDARNGAAYLGLGVQKEGEPLTDVDLTTTITHPSGRVEEVTFTDAEKSGIYSLLFDSFSTNGVYQVDVKASNASGNAKITYRGYSDQDETQDPLFPMTDNFEIVHHAQFWVTGADRMVPVSGIYLSSSSFELGVGESGVLTAEISPENATNQELDWMSMDNSVASVNKNTGVVTGMGVGTTQIYAIAHNNVQVECTVTVTATYTPPSTPQAVSPIDGEELTEGIITLLATPFNSADGLTQIGSQWSIHSPEGEELLDEILEVPGNSYEIEASLSAGGINLDRLDAQWRVRYFYETPDNTGAATDWSDWASFSIVKRSSSHHSSGCSTYGLGVWAVVFMSFVLLKRLRKQ
jgi:uncharacterized protein YegL